MSFVSASPDVCSDIVIEVLYASSCFIAPRYNGTPLYLSFAANISNHINNIQNHVHDRAACRKFTLINELSSNVDFAK